MSILPAERLPSDSAGLELRREATAILDAYRAFLKNPAFESNVDLAVLTKLAADEQVPARERRRAAEMLLRFRLKAMETLATLEGVREQVLKSLGIETGPTAVAMTQVNQRIVIERADDWRAAPAIDADVGVPSPTAEANGATGRTQVPGSAPPTNGEGDGR